MVRRRPGAARGGSGRLGAARGGSEMVRGGLATPRKGGGGRSACGSETARERAGARSGAARGGSAAPREAVRRSVRCSSEVVGAVRWRPGRRSVRVRRRGWPGAVRRRAVPAMPREAVRRSVRVWLGGWPGAVRGRPGNGPGRFSDAPGGGSAVGPCVARGLARCGSETIRERAGARSGCGSGMAGGGSAAVRRRSRDGRGWLGAARGQLRRMVAVSPCDSRRSR